MDEIIEPGDVGGTGHFTEIPTAIDKIPDFDPRSGNHYWIMIASFHVEPSVWQPNDKPILDYENLVSFTGPGCFYCENPYTAYYANRKCKGMA